MNIPSRELPEPITPEGQLVFGLWFLFFFVMPAVLVLPIFMKDDK